ncbi:nitrogenase-stabilizing/protective protein NifW [Nitrincola alkalisediminis]|uniref:nitrogenase-stabilizing/protective protein NifW n=1 Tax=Nitrincola alkalisediminis TaxID=1366656 RepID=UPI001873E73F|nr:nitrogenase-stabilizing/protective protein NifW [Nitrincola alkalisediminis]
MKTATRFTSIAELKDEMQDLESAEDFLEFFEIDFVPTVVQVNRLHILQRFHNHIHAEHANLPDQPNALYNAYRHLLDQAYQSFIHSNAQQEKVLKVFNRAAPGKGFVSLSAIAPVAGGPK